MTRRYYYKFCRYLVLCCYIDYSSRHVKLGILTKLAKVWL